LGRLVAPLLRPINDYQVPVIPVYDVIFEGKSAFGITTLKPRAIKRITFPSSTHKKEPKPDYSPVATIKLKEFGGVIQAQLDIVSWKVSIVRKGEAGANYKSVPGGVIVSSSRMSLSESSSGTRVPIIIGEAEIMFDIKILRSFKPTDKGLYEFTLRTGEKSVGKFGWCRKIGYDTYDCYYLTGDVHGISMYISLSDVELFEFHNELE